MQTTRCRCGRRLIHLDADGRPLIFPVCVYSGKINCDAPPLDQEDS